MSVRMSPARIFLVGPKDFQARRLERRLDQLSVDAIEIDLVALAVLLHAERHGDKGVWLHIESPMASKKHGRSRFMHNSLRPMEGREAHDILPCDLFESLREAIKAVESRSRTF